MLTREGRRLRLYLIDRLAMRCAVFTCMRAITRITTNVNMKPSILYVLPVHPTTSLVDPLQERSDVLIEPTALARCLPHAPIFPSTSRVGLQASHERGARGEARAQPIYHVVDDGRT